MKTLFSSMLMAGTILVGSFGFAETIELIDGTRISGTITHAYGPAIEVKSEGEEVMALQLVNVKRITFTKPEARQEFATPEKTFTFYLELIREGKLAESAVCYRMMYQKMMAEQMTGMSETDKAAMQEQMAKTEFKIGGAIIEDNQARLTVVQTMDGKEQNAEMLLIKENGEWKLAMPSGPVKAPAAVIENAKITLSDGSEVTGQLAHMYKDSVELRNSGGSIIELVRESIVSIDILPAKIRTQFSTPEKAFSYYLSLLKQGKIEQTVECYRLMLQSMMASQIMGLTPEDRVAAQKDAQSTTYRYSKPVIKNNKATLSITRAIDKNEETMDIVFVKENGEWKLSMPSGAAAAPKPENQQVK